MNAEEIFSQLKNDIYCRLKPSEFGGVGIFAIKEIPAGIDPFHGTTTPGHITFTSEQLDVLHPNVKRLVQDLFVFKNGVYYVPDNGLAQIDLPYYINHSNQSNLRVLTDSNTFETKRIILEGEELTADYSTYNDKEDVFER